MLVFISTGPYYGKVEDNLPTFKENAHQVLVASATVSPLRIQNIDVDYFPDTNSIYVSFTLLDQAPRQGMTFLYLAEKF
jgi:hypothetical protein